MSQNEIGELEIFDEHLRFFLPDGYEVSRSVNDQGKSVLEILYHTTIADNGEKNAEMKLIVRSQGNTTIQDGEANLKGSLHCVLKSTVQETQVAFFTVHALISITLLEMNGHAYVIMANRVSRSEDGLKEQAEIAAEHLNVILNHLEIDGIQGSFETVRAERLLFGGADPEESPFRLATPGKDQHSQLDFQRDAHARLGFLGGLVQVNATGTEFCFEPVKEMSDQSKTVSSILEKAAALDKNGFELAEKALDLAKLFRVSYEAFDAAHDREQEIKGGLIQRAETYNGLRSFAWTLSAYCTENNMRPNALNYADLHRLIEFIAGQKWINYQADEHCPTLCSGNDIHVFYLPDALPRGDRDALLHEMNKDADDELSRSSIMSLEGMRSDLEYLYPAMLRIHSALSEKRDVNEALTGNEADVLYAWCAAAYAVREPVFTEDGPMNCWFSHPDEAAKIHEQFLHQKEETEEEQAEAWLQMHEGHLSKNANIEFTGKKFVFTGGKEAENWDQIVKKLEEKGGVLRSAVSGQTDYLVCDPRYAGESKIRAALEQNTKGKKIAIVLLSELLPLLGLQEKKQSIKGISSSDITEDKQNGETASISTSSQPVTLTYKQGLKAGNDDYEIDIPDGFIIKDGAEDRDFVAWMPSAEDPNSYICSPFIFFSGAPQQGGIYAQVRTVEEFEALARMTAVGTEMSGMFEKHAYLPCLNKALPGGIGLAYDMGVIHANAYFGIGDYLKSMRLQIMVPNDKDRPAYEKIIKEVFGHMRSKKPIELLRDMDDDSFRGAQITTELAKEWDTCADEWIKHILLSRALLQRLYVNSFQVRQQNGSVTPAGLKKEIRNTLKETTEKIEKQLVKANQLYQELCEISPANKELAAMRDTIKKLAAAADQSVTLDGQELKNKSTVAEEILAALNQPKPPRTKDKKKTAKKLSRESSGEDSSQHGFINNDQLINEQKKQEDAVFLPSHIENRLYSETGSCEIVQLSSQLFINMPEGMLYRFDDSSPGHILEAEDKSTGRWLLLSRADYIESGSRLLVDKAKRRAYMNALMRMPLYEASGDEAFSFERDGLLIGCWKSIHFSDAWFLCLIYRRHVYLCQYSCNDPDIAIKDLRKMADSIRLQSAEKTEEQVYESWFDQKDRILAFREKELISRKDTFIQKRSEELLAEKDEQIKQSEDKLNRLLETQSAIQSELGHTMDALAEFEKASSLATMEIEAARAAIEAQTEDQLKANFSQRYDDLLEQAVIRRDRTLAAAKERKAIAEQACEDNKATQKMENDSAEKARVDYEKASAGLNEKTANLEKKLALLGFFQFSEKREIKTQIEELKKQTTQLWADYQRALEESKQRLARIITEGTEFANQVQTEENMISGAYESFIEDIKGIPSEIREEELCRLSREFEMANEDLVSKQKDSQIRQEGLKQRLDQARQMSESEQKRHEQIEKTYAEKMNSIDSEAQAAMSQLRKDIEEAYPFPTQPPVPIRSLLKQLLRKGSWQTAEQLRGCLPKEYESAEIEYLDTVLKEMASDGAVEISKSRRKNAAYKLPT